MPKPASESGLSSTKSSSDYFIGSNFHSAKPYQGNIEYLAGRHAKVFPPRVTLGFRHSFWRVFSRISHFDLTDQLDWLEHRWELKGVWIAESRNLDISVHLDDPTNILAVFLLRPLTGLRCTLQETIFNLGLDEQSAYLELTKSLAGQPCYKHLESLTHSRGLNALFIWESSEPIIKKYTGAALFAYHAFGLLLIWRIGRKQNTISLSPSSAEFRRQLRDLMHIRANLLNAERYFLTRNISNDPLIRAMIRSLRRQFDLRAKIKDLVPLNEAIQRHLDSAAQLRGDTKTTILNVIAFVIAVIGVPMSLIGSFLALSESAPIVANGIRYILQPSIKNFLLASFGLSVALLLLVGALAAGISQIVRHHS